jgi:hypothetical protein
MFIDFIKFNGWLFSKTIFFTIWKKIDEKKLSSIKKTQQTHFGFIIVFLNKNKIGRIGRQK